MAKKNTFGMGKRKKNRLFVGLVVITGIAFTATAVLAGTFVYVNGSIHKNEKAINALSEELTILEQKAEEVKAREAEYKDKLDKLQAELSKYEPIVIPDSMKTQTK